MTITEFLLARIAEDEACLRGGDGEDARECQECAFLSDHGRTQYSVDRLLAEGESKRRIVELHAADHTCTDGMAHMWASADEIDRLATNYLCPTSRALAAAYASHPDYREEWRP